MASFKFFLKEPKSTRETLIYLIIWDKNKSLKYSTQKTIHPVNWDFNGQRAKEGLQFIKGKDINGIIGNIKNSAETFVTKERTLTGTNPSLSQIKNYLDSIYRVNKNVIEKLNPNFIEYFEQYINESSKRINPKTNKIISKSTIKSLRNTLTLLKEYNKGNRNTEKFEGINLDWYFKFMEYLNESKTYGINTSGKHISNIKTILRSATERGLNDNLSYMSKKFVGSRVDSDTIYLTEQELSEIFKLNLTKNKRLERVRDLFIVGCYTGLRFSDVSKIRDINIQKEFLTIKTQKTSTKVKIPYHPFVRKIMAKYKGKTENSLPPSVSNTKMNLYIKEVCEKVKILHNEVEVTKTKGGLEVISKQKKYSLVSTHTMRRSFATNLYDQEVSVADIMSVTGHKTEGQFFKYIRREKEEGARKIQQFWNQKLNSKVS